MTILYGFEKRWLRSFAWQALVCTKKAYLFPKGEGRNFLKWKKKCKDKDFNLACGGEMFKKWDRARF